MGCDDSITGTANITFRVDGTLNSSPFVHNEKWYQVEEHGAWIFSDVRNLVYEASLAGRKQFVSKELIMPITIEEVRQALAASKTATWTVLPDSDWQVSQQGLGRLEPTPEMIPPRTRNVSKAIAAARAFRQNGQTTPRALTPPQTPSPPVVDWRNHQGINAVTSVKDQGSCGSCTPFATIALIESMLLIERRILADLSEAEFGFCAGGLFPGSCGGWWEGFSIRRALVDGAADDSVLQYANTDQVYCPVIMAVDRVRATQEAVLDTNPSRKRYINEVGPMLACFDVYEDFDSYGGGVYKHVTGAYRGGHCVEVIGYNDNQGCWIAKNSWGTGNGEAGFFRIGYGECNFDRWAFRGLSGFTIGNRWCPNTKAFQSLPGLGYQVAFQANTSNLWTVGADNHGDWGLGMMPGTSPAIAALPGGGYVVAFQANTGNLWTIGADNRGDWGLGMMAGTSPAIAVLPNGGYAVAFQANTSNLWTVGADNHGDWGLGMMVGTSPSIAAMPDGGYVVAFQANTSNLWTVGPNNQDDWGLGMMAGTSPAIAALRIGSYVVAFQANTGNLWTIGPDYHGDRGLGMMAGTSPAITALPNSQYEVAFQANTGNLWTGGADSFQDRKLGMRPGTSPAITALPNARYEVAFQANTGNLWTGGADSFRDRGLGMMGTTTPSLAR